VLQKWLPHNNSRPHRHPNDRFIQVLSGTWWVQTGAKYDPAGFKPVPAGSFVVHAANEFHYDGAKDEPALLLISGMGPSTSVQVAPTASSTKIGNAPGHRVIQGIGTPPSRCADAPAASSAERGCRSTN
jgi:hypothetical protein